MCGREQRIRTSLSLCSVTLSNSALSPALHGSLSKIRELCLVPATLLASCFTTNYLFLYNHVPSGSSQPMWLICYTLLLLREVLVTWNFPFSSCFQWHFYCPSEVSLLLVNWHSRQWLTGSLPIWHCSTLSILEKKNKKYFSLSQGWWLPSSSDVSTPTCVCYWRLSQEAHQGPHPGKDNSFPKMNSMSSW